MKKTKEYSTRTKFKKDVLIGKSRVFLVQKYGKGLIVHAMRDLRKRGYLFEESKDFIKCISEGSNPVRDTYAGASRPTVKKRLTKAEKELKKQPRKDTLGLSKAILPQDTIDSIPDSYYNASASMYDVFQIRIPKEPIGTAYINKKTDELEVSLFRNSQLSEVEIYELMEVLPEYKSWRRGRTKIFKNVSIILEKSA